MFGISRILPGKLLSADVMWGSDLNRSAAFFILRNHRPGPVHLFQALDLKGCVPVSGMSKLGRVGGPFGMGTSFPSFSVRMATAVLKLMAAFVLGMGAPALVELMQWGPVIHGLTSSSLVFPAKAILSSPLANYGCDCVSIYVAWGNNNTSWLNDVSHHLEWWPHFPEPSGHWNKPDFLVNLTSFKMFVRPQSDCANDMPGYLRMA